MINVFDYVGYDSYKMWQVSIQPNPGLGSQREYDYIDSYTSSFCSFNFYFNLNLNFNLFKPIIR